MTESKFLILVPAITARGGISNYYQVLRNEFPQNVIYFERGARSWPNRKGIFAEYLRAWRDYKAFKKRLIQEHVVLVQSSTSLGFSSVIRDGLFLAHARKAGIKTIVFFRGWDEEAEKIAEKKYLKIFKRFFFTCDRIIVLSERVKNKITEWGYDKPIDLETTVVDRKLLSGLSIEVLQNKYREAKNTKSINILFLSRLEQRKGIYELLDAFHSVQQTLKGKYILNLKICGDGSEESNVRMRSTELEIENLEITGFITGGKKREVFNWAHLFVFPSYGEGMPNAVLEAMGVGLPVITTPVGGVVDFFNDQTNGFYVEIGKPDQISEKLMLMIQDTHLMENISINNFKLASERFRSDKVAKRILVIFNEILNN